MHILSIRLTEYLVFVLIRSSIVMPYYYNFTRSVNIFWFIFYIVNEPYTNESSAEPYHEHLDTFLLSIYIYVDDVGCVCVVAF